MSRLPHTITIVEPTTSTDSYGVTVLTYNGPQTAVSAFVQPKMSEQAVTDDLSAGRILARQKVYTVAPIPYNARVVHNATTYEVEGVVRWDDGMGVLHHYETVLRQVEG